MAAAKKYNKSDYAVIAIYGRLCELDKSDRNSGNDRKWHNVVTLVKKVNAYSDKIDVWQLAVYILEDKKKLIETDNSRFYVELTKKGTVGCGKRIKIT